MKKRILFIENSYSIFAPGGSHKSLINLYDNLDLDNFQPFILLNERNDIITRLFGDRDVYYLDHQTYDIATDSKSGFYSPNIKPQNNWYKIIKANLGIVYRILRDVIPMTMGTIKIIRKLDIDIVHTNTRIGSNQFGIIAAWLCRKKIVAHERTWTKNNWFNKIIAKIPDKIICISQSIKNNLLKNGYKDEKCVIIFNGRELPKLNGALIQKYSEEYDNSFNIGLMSNISEYKGHTVFVKGAIQLLKIYPKFKFYIYGDTNSPKKDYLTSLQELLNENNCSKHIRFMGFVKNVNTIIQKLHVNCCLTLGEEPLSGTIIESFINKTAIVATDTGGSSELIRNKVNGILIPPNSVDAFVKSIQLLYENNNLAKKIVSLGYEFSQNNLSSDIYAEKISSVYSEILD